MIGKINILQEPFYKNVAHIIFKTLNFKKKQNIFLTGGDTFSKIYQHINILPSWNKYFLTDERINTNIKKTNYFTLKKNFINRQNKKNFFLINQYPKNINLECKRYAELIPKRIDLILLSLGVDGHIASIFKKKLNQKKEGVIYFKKNKIRETRVSINFPIINSAKKIFIVLNGKNKINIFKNYIYGKEKKYPIFEIKNKNIYIFISKNLYNSINKL